MYDLAMLKRVIPEITAAELAAILREDAAAQILDVRESAEVAAGMIPGSFHIPLGDLRERAKEMRSRTEPVYVYCAVGARSLVGAQLLRELQFEKVYSVSDGYRGWTALATCARSRSESRYSRQIALPEFGEPGQEKLRNARVLLVGVGGIGSPAALYLAAAGVGTLGLVDHDEVALSNLQRQILFPTERVGHRKVQAAADALTRLNPEVRCQTFSERVSSGNAEALFRDFELIIDGSDNFETRYAVNDVAVRVRKPLIHGAVHRFEGMLSVFGMNGGPCLRCLFPEEPGVSLIPNCAEAGVLGVLPGIIGVMAATEAIKIAAGIGEPLSGRVLRFDALSSRFYELRLNPRRNCVCRNDQALI